MHIFRSSTKIANFIETTNSFPHIFHPKQRMYISQNWICRQKAADTTLGEFRGDGLYITVLPIAEIIR